MKSFLLSVFLVTCQFASKSVKAEEFLDERRCQGQYNEHEFPANQEFELNFCMEHSGRTCCGKQDTTRVKEQYWLTRHYADDLSPYCLSSMSDAMCSVCDSDIGTSLSVGMCPNFCLNMFLACQDQYVDPYLNSESQLPFCRTDSLMCYKLTDYVADPQSFCELMGFKVSSDPNNCFNGESNVGPGKKYQKLNRSKKQHSDDDLDEDDDIVDLKNVIKEKSKYSSFFDDPEGYIRRMGKSASRQWRKFKRQAYKFYETKLKSLVEWIFMVIGLAMLYELIYNRQIFSYCTQCCKKDSQRQKQVNKTRDLLRKEKSELIKQAKHKKNK